MTAIPQIPEVGPNPAELVLDHLQDRIAVTEVQDHPFPFFLVDDALPEELIDGLVADFPSEAMFNEGRPTSQGRRNLDHDGVLQRRLCEGSHAWKVFGDAFNSARFVRTLVAPFRQRIALHGGTLGPSDALASKFDVTRAGAGYTRSPHLDRRHHLVAMLVYLNDREEFGGTGGDFVMYAHKDPTRRDKFPPADAVEAVATVPPKRNRLVAFLNTSTALHGITPMRDSLGHRRFVYGAVDNMSRSDMWPAVSADPARRRSFLAE